MSSVRFHSSIHTAMDLNLDFFAWFLHYPDEALVSRDAYTHLAACYDYILRYLTPLQFNELSHCILRYNVVKYKTTS